MVAVPTQNLPARSLRLRLKLPLLTESKAGLEKGVNVGLGCGRHADPRYEAEMPRLCREVKLRRGSVSVPGFMDVCQET